MSAELQWELVRKHNAFLVKRNGVKFSVERGNLISKHSFAHSGLVHPHAVAISRDGDKIVIERLEGGSARSASKKTRDEVPVDKKHASKTANEVGKKIDDDKYGERIAWAASVRAYKLCKAASEKGQSGRTDAKRAKSRN